MLSGARASGSSDTRAGCPGLVMTGPVQSGSCVAGFTVVASLQDVGDSHSDKRYVTLR